MESDLSKRTGVWGSVGLFFAVSPRLSPPHRHRDEQIEQYSGKERRSNHTHVETRMENYCYRGRPSPYSKCMRRLFNGNGKPRPCRNRRCPSKKCRAGYAEKEAAILERSFRTKPPHFTFVLGFDDGESTGDRRMAAYLNTLNQKIKDRRKSEGITLEYDNRIEFGRDSNPHCHLTLITSAPWSEGQAHSRIRALWMASCPHRKVSVYGDWVHKVVGLANYVCKNVKDRGGVRGPPPGWNGKTCRFVRTSKGFLSGSKKSLWKEHCEEWYLDDARFALDNGAAERAIRPLAVGRANCT